MILRLYRRKNTAPRPQKVM